MKTRSGRRSDIKQNIEMRLEQVASICRGCLTTERKMVNATLYEAEFKKLTGINISSSDGLPQWLCYECVALLQKCIRFRNKMMNSHHILCQYVMETVRFAHNKDATPQLSRTTIEHYDIHGTQTDQQAAVADDANMPIIVNIDSIQGDKNDTEERRERIPDMDVTTNLLSYDLAESDTENIMICSVTSNHEERTEQAETRQELQISPVVGDIDMLVMTEVDVVEVKDENSTATHEDNITVEDSRVLQNVLDDVYSSPKPNHEVQKEQEKVLDTQVSLEPVQAAEETMPSAVTPEKHLDEHTEVTPTPHAEEDEKEVKNDIESNVQGNNTPSNKISYEYICDKCNKGFNDKPLLINHIREHSNKKPFKCEVCRRFYINKNSFSRHIRIHTGDNLYKCDVCLKCFTQKIHLDEHYRIHDGDKPYKCDVCMKKFRLKCNLTVHYRIHTREKPYKCDVCTKCFIAKTHLNVHYRIHVGKKYKCNICKKCFSYKSSLNRHNRIHTGDKPHKCDECMECFSRKSQLNAHYYRTHTGDKPYKCSVCMKGFIVKTSFKRHMRIHTKKLLKCDICMNLFGQKHHLNRLCIHSILTCDKPYYCDACMTGFKHKRSLIKHVGKHNWDNKQ